MMFVGVPHTLVRRRRRRRAVMLFPLSLALRHNQAAKSNDAKKHETNDEKIYAALNQKAKEKPSKSCFPNERRRTNVFTVVVFPRRQNVKKFVGDIS